MEARTLKRVVLAGVCCASISAMAKAETKVASVDAPPSDDKAGAPAAPPPEQDKPAAMAAPPQSLVDAHQQERSAKNAIYAEGLGAGLYYSVNYERAFGDFSARLGFGYVSVGVTETSTSGTSGGSGSASFLAVPITVSYLGIGSKTHMFELGAGATILSLGANASAFETNSSSSSSASSTLVFGNVITAYRLQPADGGFFMRLGLNTVVGLPGFPVIPWPAIALGGTF
jgi:hypothetical protein